MIYVANQNKRGKYTNAKTGTFHPLNPSKYEGSELPIYKSALEHRMMLYLDKSPSIVKWNYEPVSIKYFDKTRNCVRRYFIDFSATVKVGNLYKKFWFEIKPYEETIPPKNKRNVKNMATYMTNMCKWESAKTIAQSKGVTFQVITEQQLI